MGDMASSTAIRTASIQRKTNETNIECTLALDVHPTHAPQVISVKTGIGFLDHVGTVAIDCALLILLPKDAPRSG